MVTHEAATGTVGNKELEALMSRGRDEGTAVDIIGRGHAGGVRNQGDARVPELACTESTNDPGVTVRK